MRKTVPGIVLTPSILSNGVLKMSFRATLTYVGSPEATLRELRRAAKPEIAALITYWHDKYTAGHFEPEAVQKYKYKRRSKKYKKRKPPRFRDNPLMYSGNARRMILRSIKVTSTSKGGKGVMQAPDYFYAYHKDYTQPDKADEVARTIVQEVRDMAERLDAKITARLNNVKTRETIRV